MSKGGTTVKRSFLLALAGMAAACSQQPSVISLPEAAIRTPPVMIDPLTEADDRALALETRGLTLPGVRTPLDPPRDTALDRLARIAAALGVAACAWWRFS